jgi:hypothetical protein
VVPFQNETAEPIAIRHRAHAMSAAIPRRARPEGPRVAGIGRRKSARRTGPIALLANTLVCGLPVRARANPVRKSSG